MPLSGGGTRAAGSPSRNSPGIDREMDVVRHYSTRYGYVIAGLVYDASCKNERFQDWYFSFFSVTLSPPATMMCGAVPFRRAGYRSMRMRKRAIFIGVLLVLGFAGVAFAMGDKPGEVTSGSWRYKMTVAVETPEGIKTGSAVREVHVQRPPINMPHVTSDVKVKGEAVVVDLGKRGVLFALLRGPKGDEDYPYLVLFDAFPSGHGGTTPKAIEYYSTLKNAKATLTFDQYPMLVTFRDLNDPKTVTAVLEIEKSGKPIAPEFRLRADRFAELFGTGVTLKEITIEMTEEPVTRRIKTHLPSFGEKTGFEQWFKSLPYDDPRRIGPYDFIK